MPWESLPATIITDTDGQLKPPNGYDICRQMSQFYIYFLCSNRAFSGPCETSRRFVDSSNLLTPHPRSTALSLHLFHRWDDFMDVTMNTVIQHPSLHGHCRKLLWSMSADLVKLLMLWSTSAESCSGFLTEFSSDFPEVRKCISKKLLCWELYWWRQH